MSGSDVNAFLHASSGYNLVYIMGYYRIDNACITTNRGIQK